MESSTSYVRRPANLRRGLSQFQGKRRFQGFRIATSFGVCVKTVRKWVARFEAEGAAGLCDRSSRPHRLHRPTPDAAVARITGLRRERWTGQRIAAELGVSAATVSRVLRRLGLSRLRDLEPMLQATGGGISRFINRNIWAHPWTTEAGRGEG